MRKCFLWHTAFLAFLLSGPYWARAQAPLEVGRVLPYRAESPHPYPAGAGARPAVWTNTVVSPGATFVRVHFMDFRLAPGDYVTVSSPDGSDFWTYTGQGPNGDGDFWSFAVKGDMAVIEIHGGSSSEHGYRVDAVGHGTVDIARPRPTPEIVCGTDGREDVACHLPEVDAAQKPVARLLFVKNGVMLACTGWLVSGSNDSTLMTNNHCLKNQTQVKTLQATFNFQRTDCRGATDATTTDYAGGKFLKTSPERGGLDYTLLTLQGNPELTWSELVPTAKTVAVGDLIWFVQHPGGAEKLIGYWDDADHTTRCQVSAVDQTYKPAAPQSQIGYACDSSDGASGSPITDPTTGQVIALHHFGGVSKNACLNSGTEMSKICSDAGSLLICVP